MDNYYFDKYLKYKTKYLQMKGGGGTENDEKEKNDEVKSYTVKFIDPNRQNGEHNIFISRDAITVNDDKVIEYNFNNIRIFKNIRTFMLYNNNIYMITNKGIFKYLVESYIMIPPDEYENLSKELIGINNDKKITEEIRKEIVDRLYSDRVKIFGQMNYTNLIIEFNKNYNNNGLIDKEKRPHYNINNFFPSELIKFKFKEINYEINRDLSGYKIDIVKNEKEEINMGDKKIKIIKINNETIIITDTNVYIFDISEEGGSLRLFDPHKKVFLDPISKIKIFKFSKEELDKIDKSQILDDEQKKLIVSYNLINHFRNN